MAKSRRPLRAFYLLYVSRSTHTARSTIGLLGPLEARTKREAVGAFTKALDAPVKAKCLFVDTTGLPPAFISDYERACHTEETIEHMRRDSSHPQRLCGGRTRFGEMYFCPEDNRVHIGPFSGNAVYSPGSGLIKTVDLKKAKLASLSEKPADTAHSPGIFTFHLTNGHIINAA